MLSASGELSDRAISASKGETADLERASKKSLSEGLFHLDIAYFLSLVQRYHPCVVTRIHHCSQLITTVYMKRSCDLHLNSSLLDGMCSLRKRPDGVIVLEKCGTQDRA